MIKSTITYWNVVKKILEELDMAMFGVKYPKKVSVFYQIGFLIFLISCRLATNSFLVWYSFIFRVKFMGVASLKLKGGPTF